MACVVQHPSALQPFYGEVPCHVRHIDNGLFGWYGNDTATLHPVAPKRRAELLIEGMGGSLRAFFAPFDHGPQ